MTSRADSVYRFAVGGNSRRRVSRGVVRLRSLAAVLVLVAAAGCGGPSGQELAEIFNRMEIPDDWTLVSEEFVDPPCLRSPTEICPRAMRIYEAPLDPGFEAEARAMMEIAGLGTRAISEECQTGVPGCRVTGRGKDRYVEATIVSSGDHNNTVTIHLRVTTP